MEAKDDSTKGGKPETVAKYVIYNSELRPAGKIRGQKLFPPAGRHLSSFDVDGMSSLEICQHGRSVIDRVDEEVTEHSRRIKGYCLYLVAQLEDAGIVVEPDDQKEGVPPRHVALHFPDDMAKRREIGMVAERLAITIHDGDRPFFGDCA